MFAIRRYISYCKLPCFFFASLTVAAEIIRVMFCSIVNLATFPGDEFASQFLFVIGGTEMLSLPGCYMLIHLKEAADAEDEARSSNIISSDIRVPEFRTYSGLETLYRNRTSSREEDRTL